MKKNIVVIEDDRTIVELLTDILGADGYRVYAAYNGSEGLTLIKEIMPDLVISDIMMPLMDGYQVLQKLRNNPETALIPFIFLTAKDEYNEIRNGMNLGADDYLPKPVSSKLLLSSVETRLKRSSEITQHIGAAMGRLSSNHLPHEFRTPIAGIMGIGELLQRYDTSPDELREYGAILSSCAKRLLRITENIALYYDLLQGRVSFHYDLVGTLFLQERLQERLVADPRLKDITLDIEEAGIEIPRDYVQRMLSELIDNALKFSPSGTKVVISGRKKEHAYVLSVADSGRGMTPDQVARIDAFRQFNREQFEQQGAGLGLAIVSLIAKQIGARFRIFANQPCGAVAELSFSLETEINGQ